MIPEEFKAALQKCAEEMGQACGHYVGHEVTEVSQQICDAGIGIETATTIKVVFWFRKIEKIK